LRFSFIRRFFATQGPGIGLATPFLTVEVHLMDNRTLLAGVGLGAALAFILDPDRGARRRALVRDKAVRGARLTGDALDATMRDMSNRTRGIAAAARSKWSGGPVDDVTLVERVRAKVGRVCSHPRAIDVDVRDGEVTLRGPIMAGEMDDVMSTAAAVPGVCSVVNALEPYESADGVPSLQGEGQTAGSSYDLLQRNWAPATRALVSVGALAAAGAIAAYARR
jgi:hypothetical protein